MYSTQAYMYDTLSTDYWELTLFILLSVQASWPSLPPHHTCYNNKEILPLALNLNCIVGNPSIFTVGAGMASKCIS